VKFSGSKPLRIIFSNEFFVVSLREMRNFPTRMELSNHKGRMQNNASYLMEGKMLKSWLVLVALGLQVFTFGCRTTAGGDDSDVKRRVTGQNDIDQRVASLGPDARKDLRYLIFYKGAGSLMHAKLTRDVNGNDVDKELGLVSWAPSTLTEATKNYNAHPNFGAKYFLEDVALLSNTKKIYHFMPINGNFAVHSANLGGVPRPGRPMQLRADGKYDSTGHGCIRIANKTATTGGHEYLYDYALSMKRKYGLGKIPLVVDYLPFVNARSITNRPTNQEVPREGGRNDEEESISADDDGAQEQIGEVREFEASGPTE
jgi:hypothetical protein